MNGGHTPRNVTYIREYFRTCTASHIGLFRMSLIGQLMDSKVLWAVTGKGNFSGSILI